MGKLRLGNYVFMLWKGDHGPRHVHILRDGRLVAKWNLDSDCLMAGSASARVRRLLEGLRREEKL